MSTPKDLTPATSLTEHLGWLQQVLASVQLPQYAPFLAAEADYWRAEAHRLQRVLASVQREAENATTQVTQSEAGHVPPEPPIGTQFFDGTERVWMRGDLGWYCAKSNECKNCPCEWVEAYDRLPFTARRVLPGGVR